MDIRLPSICPDWNVNPNPTLAGPYPLRIEVIDIDGATVMHVVSIINLSMELLLAPNYHVSWDAF